MLFNIKSTLVFLFANLSIHNFYSYDNILIRIFYTKYQKNILKNGDYFLHAISFFSNFRIDS